MSAKESKKILENLKSNQTLSNEEIEAIDIALKHISHIEYNKGSHTDFQGWPIEKCTMKELREFVKENNGLSDDTKILVLEDDGMGYGGNNGYCSDIYLSGNEKGETEIKIWF